MSAVDRNRIAYEAILVVLHIFAWILTPLYRFKLASVSVVLMLAGIFYGLVAVSGVLAWRSSRYEWGG